MRWLMQDHAVAWSFKVILGVAVCKPLSHREPTGQDDLASRKRMTKCEVETLHITRKLIGDRTSAVARDRGMPLAWRGL